MNYSLWVAVMSLAGTGVLALTAGLGKRGEVKVDALTSLTAGQLAFVNTLSNREARLLERIDRQDVQIESLRHRCAMLEGALRSAGLPIPTE